jgi:hypothetical protein
MPTKTSQKTQLIYNLPLSPRGRSSWSGRTPLPASLLLADSASDPALADLVADLAGIGSEVRS